jgi:hypothetical protein
MKPKDLIGRIFGRLTVLLRHSSTRHGLKWRCSCSCGRITVVDSSALLSGRTQSCGCLNQDERVSRTKPHRRSPEYKIWDAMVQRCTNPKNKHYKNYGGRGVKVCERWRDFDQFYVNCGPRPSPAHTIERVDNNKDYEPDNCKWATRKEQQNNTRANRWLTLHGETYTVAQWAEKLCINPCTLYARLHVGWSVERTLTSPVRAR